MTAGEGNPAMKTSHENQLISVQPNDLKFIVELRKQSYCDLKVSNATDRHVAFKVKTTSPKRYFVRPNTGVIQPWDSCAIRVTLQAQQEYPPDMQCKDKFLVQSTVVAAHADVDELPPDTFNKEGGKTIEECKLRVLYAFPSSAQANSEASKGSASDSKNDLQRLMEERDAAVRLTTQLQQELETLKKRKQRSNPGFSLIVTIIVGLLGLIIGFFINLSSPSPSPSPATE